MPLTRSWQALTQFPWDHVYLFPLRKRSLDIQLTLVVFFPLCHGEWNRNIERTPGCQLWFLSEQFQVPLNSSLHFPRTQKALFKNQSFIYEGLTGT